MKNHHVALAGSALVAILVAVAMPRGNETEPLDAVGTGDADARTYSNPNPWSSDEVLAQNPVGNRSASDAASNRSASGFSERGSKQSMSGGRVALMRERDGHFYASPDIDGRSVRMMVDTGASIIALTGHDAEAIGVTWDPAAVRPIARGASGDVYGVPVTLANVTLGNLSASNVQAVIVPEGLDVTLLGQSFLTQVGKVEISGDRMVLSD